MFGNQKSACVFPCIFLFSQCSGSCSRFLDQKISGQAKNIPILGSQIGRVSLTSMSWRCSCSYNPQTRNYLILVSKIVIFRIRKLQLFQPTAIFSLHVFFSRRFRFSVFTAGTRATLHIRFAKLFMTILFSNFFINNYLR